MSVVCELCNRTFKYPSIFRIHYRSHTGEKPFQCEFCQRLFSHEAHLIVHNQIHVQEERYITEFSNETFLQESTFNEYTERHDDERKDGESVKVSFFNEISLDGQNIALKPKNSAGVNRGELISKEGDSNSINTHLIVHNQIHMREKQYVSEFSNETFLQESTFNECTERHDGERKDGESVNESFFNEKSLDRQNIALKPKNSAGVNRGELISKEGDSSCINQIQAKKEQYEISNKLIFHEPILDEFTELHNDGGKDTTLSHENDIDRKDVILQQDELYNCVSSEERISTESLSNSTIANKDAKSLLNYKKCDEHHLKKSKLSTRSHVHAKLEPLKNCTGNKTFSRKRNLRGLKNVHLTKKPFECNLCSKAFSEKKNLKAHQLVHSKEKQFKCVICSKAFSQKGNMKTHFRIHTKERPYECEMCGKSFSQLSILNAHHRTHTNEKPYVCDVCGQAFTQASNLNVHCRMHTLKNINNVREKTQPENSRINHRYLRARRIKRL